MEKPALTAVDLLNHKLKQLCCLVMYGIQILTEVDGVKQRWYLPSFSYSDQTASRVSFRCPHQMLIRERDCVDAVWKPCHMRNAQRNITQL